MIASTALRLSPQTLVAALAATFISFPAGAQDFEWTGQMGAGHTLEVKGIIGDINATAASGGTASAQAVKREGRHGYAEDVRFEVIQDGTRITICAMYPEKRGERPNECLPGERGRQGTHDNDTEVTFTVQVPRGVRFVGRTVTGDIEARSLGDDVEAHTVTGDIDVSTTGHARAKTVTGHIYASMGRADWTGDLEISTVTGRIVVELPEGAGANVTASTVTGGISTDFPLRVQGRFMSKRVSGTIGNGGRELLLETVTGSIQLRQSG